MDEAVNGRVRNLLHEVAETHHVVYRMVALDREYGSEPRDQAWEDYYAGRLLERLK